jgi:hypothetical protein
MGPWIEDLVSELKSKSTTTWKGRKKAIAAMPNTIEGVIRHHSAKIDIKLLRSHYEQAKSHLDQLAQKNDPYSLTLRRASNRFSELLKRFL